MLQLQDLKTIELHSAAAATFIAKCASIVDKHFADEALDAMWELALACGCDLSERFSSNGHS
jgi:hypothetical protein